MRRLILLLGAFGGVGCKTQREAFCEKVVTCDPRGAADQCGTTCAGRPMTCFRGSDLGGESFCTEACDPAAPSASAGGADASAGGAHWRCLDSGALVQVCRPHAGAGGPGACPAPLSCYRTSLLADEGVCLKMRVCADDGDCNWDSNLAKCAGTAVRELTDLPLETDHLQCIQSTCKSSGSNCQDGSCLSEFYDTERLLDICVPNCDGNGRCPPNFVCERTPATPGGPNVCVPGLPGQPCRSDQDCLIGSCADTGAGFSECALPLTCSTDADCGFLNAPTNTFVCVEGVAGAGRRCISLRPFGGSNCTDSSGCAAGQQCAYYSPFVVAQGHGECRLPCDADRRCPARGGIPHVCLDGGGGGCYPGVLGLPCASSSECLPGLSCQAAGADERTLIVSPTICTTACQTDVDCSGNVLIRNSGFCREGLCRLTGQPGAPCDRGPQCLSGRCVSSQCAN